MALPDIQPVISVASEGIDDDCSVDTDNPFGLLSGQDDFDEAHSITAPPTDEPPAPPTEIDKFVYPPSKDELIKMKDVLTTNKLKECIEKLGWLEKKLWDPRIDVIFEGGQNY